jgi:hypothetical protein
MITRNFPGGKNRPARNVDNLAAICEPNVITLPLLTTYGRIIAKLIVSRLGNIFVMKHKRFIIVLNGSYAEADEFRTCIIQSSKLTDSLARYRYPSVFEKRHSLSCSR